MYKITKTKKVVTDNPTRTYKFVFEYQHGDADAKSIKTYYAHEDNLCLTYFFTYLVSKYDWENIGKLTDEINKAKGANRDKLKYEQLSIALAYEDDIEENVHEEVFADYNKLFNDNTDFKYDYFKLGYYPEYDMFSYEEVFSDPIITYFDESGVEYDVKLKRK